VPPIRVWLIGQPTSKNPLWQPECYQINSQPRILPTHKTRRRQISLYPSVTKEWNHWRHYVPSKEQKADIKKKPLPKPDFERMRKELGVDGPLGKNRKD
jgi:hypothetical protein